MWDGISGLFWFAFPWWLRMLNISLGASQTIGIPQLSILCLALYLILIGLFWSLESNLLRSLYILDISPLLDVGLVKIFSHLLFPVLCYWQYSLPYKSFAILWGPICQFLILEHKLLVFCSGKFHMCSRFFSIFFSTRLSVLQQRNGYRKFGTFT